MARRMNSSTTVHTRGTLASTNDSIDTLNMHGSDHH